MRTAAQPTVTFPQPHTRGEQLAQGSCDSIAAPRQPHTRGEQLAQWPVLQCCDSTRARQSWPQKLKVPANLLTDPASLLSAAIAYL